MFPCSHRSSNVYPAITIYGTSNRKWSRYLGPRCVTQIRAKADVPSLRPGPALKQTGASNVGSGQPTHPANLATDYLARMHVANKVHRPHDGRSMRKRKRKYEIASSKGRLPPSQPVRSAQHLIA